MGLTYEKIAQKLVQILIELEKIFVWLDDGGWIGCWLAAVLLLAVWVVMYLLGR